MDRILPVLPLDCRLTQRWEASLWLSGRQLYLGGFDNQVGDGGW